jgi:hypothetical protein
MGKRVRYAIVAGEVAGDCRRRHKCRQRHFLSWGYALVDELGNLP